MSEKIKIAVDAMGGDYAPQAVVEGTILAQNENHRDIELVLVGEKEKINQELSRLKATDLPLVVQNASELITMGDPAVESLRKKDSSIAVGMRLQKEGKVDAFVSGGNTGAVMTHALMTLGRLEGVSRPAIASFLPSEKGIVVVLDAGANAECKAHNLYQFGVMGSIYTSYVLKKENPRIGLLSIGEESTKGNDLTLTTYKLLSEDSSLNFIGNVEGRDVLKGTCDVVVCDGFVGNIVLKFAESIDGFLTWMVKKRVKESFLFRLGAFLVKVSIRDLRKVLDYTEYGGAPLLGVNGVCIICHGESPPKAIKNALKLAADMVRERVNEHITKILRDKEKTNQKNQRS
ncbi:MAG: phosphate acyltransferase PlsX [candidate division Zixibacteria bacterium]|nr:phosphate acyltransferase PlsX [candidate division Zixibacteria bacterium]